MRTIEYALQGKEVPASMRGQIVKIKAPESVAEAASLCENGETGVVDKFTDAYVIACQGRLRTAAGKKDATLESVRAVASGFKIKPRAEGTGERKEVKPETVAKRAAASSGNKLFTRIRDAKDRAAELARFVKLNVVDEAEFTEWLSTNPAPAAEAQPQQA